MGKVRANSSSGMALTEAVTQAVKDCIGEGILTNFLKQHSSEVINILTAEWNAEQASKVAHEEGREEGIDISATIISALKRMNLLRKSQSDTRYQSER